MLKSLALALAGLTILSAVANAKCVRIDAAANVRNDSGACIGHYRASTRVRVASWPCNHCNLVGRNGWISRTGNNGGNRLTPLTTNNCPTPAWRRGCL